MVNTIFKKLRDRFRKKEPEDTEKEEDPSKTSSGAQISSKIRTYLEKELLTVRFLDWISEESFDFIYQQKIYDNYITSHTEQFLNVEKAHPSEKARIGVLRSEYERLNIKEAAFAIKEKSEGVARQNNIKAPYLKRFNRINIIIMAALIGSIFIFYIPGLEKFRFYSFLLILPICFLPNIIKKQMQKKWNEFKYLHREELQEEIYEEISNIKIFIQLLLDDARDYMLQEQFPLQSLQFPLMSSDYLNLQLVEEKIQQEQVQYLFRFEYPEGVEPFEVPKTMKSGGVGGTTAVSKMDLGEDNQNDLFLIIKNPNYREDGSLNTDNLDYVELGYKPIAESLLEDSDFTPIDNPEKIVRDIENFTEVSCNCGDHISVGEIHIATPKSYENFKFYLMIGAPCEKCNARPFILSPLPNMTIPQELDDIFTDPIPMEVASRKPKSTESEDLFIIIKDAGYDDKKMLNLSSSNSYKVKEVDKVHELLGDASFKKLKEPGNRFYDVDEFQFECGCDQKSIVEDVQLGTSKKFGNFKFYLIIGRKCKKCNIEPFLLVATPDQEIPEELKTIF